MCIPDRMTNHLFTFLQVSFSRTYEMMREFTPKERALIGQNKNFNGSFFFFKKKKLVKPLNDYFKKIICIKKKKLKNYFLKKKILSW